MKLCYIIFGLFILGTSVNGIEESKTVQLTQGLVRGYKEPDANIFVFYGIPYATVPSGQMKYKPPLSPPKWTEPLEATNRLVTCPPFFSTNEDCLIANVYVPNTNTTNLPVLVITHAGGFVTGFGDMLQPKTLVNSQKIIAVTFNYRLGVNGFLCLGTQDVPGNAGLKDQVALLRWVRGNIDRFGGNPNDVTLSGFSSGSISANLMTLSPLAKGLFNKVILGSGADLSTFAVQQDPLLNAKNFAKTFPNVTLNVDNIQDLEMFFKMTSLSDLMAHMKYLNDDFTIDFSPCIERQMNAESFLNDAPINILRSGNYTKVPMLNGFTDKEGLMRIDEFDVLSVRMNQNFSNFLPGDLVFDSTAELENMAKSVEQFYFGDKPVGPETVLYYVKYASDIAFTVDTLRSIKLRLESGSKDIYLYEFSFADGNSRMIPYINTTGAGHMAESEVVLDKNTFLLQSTDNMTPSLKEIKEIMTQMWLNFILTGKPVPVVSATLPQWPPLSTFNSPYMSLNLPVTLKTAPLLQVEFDFWQKIYDKHYKVPKPSAYTSGCGGLGDIVIVNIIMIIAIKMLNI